MRLMPIRTLPRMLLRSMLLVAAILLTMELLLLLFCCCLAPPCPCPHTRPLASHIRHQFRSLLGRF